MTAFGRFLPVVVGRSRPEAGHVNDLALASNHRSIAIDTSLRAMGLFAALLESLLLLAASLGSQPLSCSGGLVFCAQRRRFQSEGV